MEEEINMIMAIKKKCNICLKYCNSNFLCDECIDELNEKNKKCNMCRKYCKSNFLCDECIDECKEHKKIKKNENCFICLKKFDLEEYTENCSSCSSNYICYDCMDEWEEKNANCYGLSPIYYCNDKSCIEKNEKKYKKKI